MRCSVAVSRFEVASSRIEHGRSHVEGAGESEPLALAAGEPHTTLAHDRLEPVRQLADDIVELREPDRLLDRRVVDLVAPPAEGDVGAKRVVDEVDVLRHVADRSLPRLPALGHRHAVDRDRSAIRGEEAEDDVEQRALARSGRADDSDRLARAAPRSSRRAARAPLRVW